jgi:hypothetical protein
MTKTSDDTLTKDEIITESGRTFRPGNRETLKNIPPDILKEMAKRKWEELQAYKTNPPMTDLL